MPLPPDLDLNGRVYSHASSDVRLSGQRMRGCKEWSHKVSVERGEARGTAREALGHTIGTVKYEFSMTVLRAYWDAYKDKARADGFSPLDRMGVATAVVSEPGKPSKKAEIHYSGINEQEIKSSDGAEAHEVTLSFAVLAILEDGKPLIDRSIFTPSAV